jgi:glycosyltransferase involved in cell wall biosynthesis
MPDGSRFFGSPSKLFEYMAMGKAIIASKLDQLAEVLEHGGTGWLVEPGNDVELSNAIELLAGNPALRCTLGQNARGEVVHKHTWQHNAARLLAKIDVAECASFAVDLRTVSS